MQTPLNLPLLIAAIDAGESFAYRFFWGHRPRKDGKLSDSCFSQWWPSMFDIDGRPYTTAEQWMMASKARMFGDVAAADQILALKDPGAIKSVGRRVKGFDQKTWDRACFDIVTEGNVAKFGQDQRLKAYLLATGDDILVEASPLDTVWGIGYAGSAPESGDPKSWRGQNLLGFALVRARLILQGELPPLR